MPILGNLSIGKRLAIVLGAILALSLATSVFAVMMLQRMGSEVDAMLQHHVKTERVAVNWSMNLIAAVQRRAAIARSSDASLVNYFAAANAESVRLSAELQKQLEDLAGNDAERAALDEVKKFRQAYQEARDEMNRLKTAGDLERANRLFTGSFEPAAQVYQAAIKRVVQLQRDQLDARGQTVEAVRARTHTLLIASAAVSLVAGALLALVLARSITRPLQHSQAIAAAIADMDLRGQPQAHYADDETGQLLRSLDAMRGALQRSLHEVRGVVDNVSTASSQIATGNHDLSARTEQAASNLQQTASAMEQLTSTVRQSAESAEQANQLARSAAEVARRGGIIVAEVVATMGEINASSRRIADIIGVIDGIAFQTNILALNAAVEAARAGEQGRGFAVVAGEVRTLAQRSAGAAKEIKALIGDSVGKVESGATQVHAAGTTMTEIVASVQRVSDIVSEITTAASEQSQGIGQVNVAVSQLDQMTQQNAALVEQSAAAAGSLQEQAQRLAHAVAAFKLEPHRPAAHLAA
jgi:methyl-accepting chemotaxis protein